MRAFPAVGWTITHVHLEDWRHPLVARPARVLLRRDRTQGYVLPIRADAHQMVGAELREASPDEWHALDPRVEWRPGRIPIIAAAGRVDFVTREMLERQRTKEADRLIARALTTDTPSETAEGLLEMADGLLGGHVVPLAAAMFLLRGEASRRERLRTRFLRAAPSGPAVLEVKLAEFTTFQRHRELADAVRAAMNEALREPVDATDWAAVRAETLARWWVRSTMSRQQVTLADMARKLNVETPRLRWLLRSGVGLADLAGLPSPAEMMNDLSHSGGDSSAEEVDALLIEAHQPRIALFAQQLAALERLTGSSDRLSRWASAMPAIVEQREMMGALNDAPPWERAHQGSEELHGTLLGLRQRDPARTAKLLEPFGAALAGAVFGTPALSSASFVSPETGPIIALASGRNIGSTRFAIAHQIGHLLDPDMEGASPRCTFAEPELDYRVGSRESFANAFAVYLLAPKRAVNAQVGNVSVRTPETLFDAAADVATVFGLSAGAALRHVLNCADVKGSDFDETIGRALGHEAWRETRDEINNDVESAWADDGMLVADALGEVPPWSVEAALRRPSAARFSELTERAVTTGLLARDAADALLQT